MIPLRELKGSEPLQSSLSLFLFYFLFGFNIITLNKNRKKKLWRTKSCKYTLVQTCFQFNALNLHHTRFLRRSP